MSVDANIAETEDLFGKTVTDLQSDINIGESAITGTLKYVNDYSSAFGGDLSSGNYIAIHAAADVPGATVTVKVTSPVVLDSDGIAVLRIADKDSQTITVVASKAGYKTATKVYSLTGLTCLSA